MPDFAADSDTSMTPDGIELDPFEMDWPWPTRRAESASPNPTTEASAPPTHAPRLP